MTNEDRHVKRRGVVSVLMAAVVIGLLAGCVRSTPDIGTTRGTDHTVDAQTAKQQMIDVVDDTVQRLGGEWKPRTGPDAPENCRLPDGSSGAHWRYLTGSTIEGTPDKDGPAVAQHWRDQGMQVTERGTSTGPVVFGGGGREIASISFSAASGNYTVQAVSLCFPGDADRMAEEDADAP